MNTDMQTGMENILAADKDWWRGAVIYQIYPRSFQDSNGDGIGDIAGIVHRLPYIASLGVDAIWVSPFFKSPMKDFGYDISDYRDIDPMFGTLEEFDLMIETAHKFGIRVMIDLVLSHTSDQHPWFQESKMDRTNPKADWYVWADPKPDGAPPNNWFSIFGGPAWQWSVHREQYYLHNFLACQPDLNFHNMDVQDALLDLTRFWLERGVDGCRLDTINFYFADKLLRDNPALPPEKRNSKIAPSVNVYNHQEHLYSKNQPENLDFLHRFRQVLDEYPAAAAVGEVGDAQYGLEILGQYTAKDKYVHMCYAFELLAKDKVTAADIPEIFAKVDEVAADGWACWAYSNHDVMRHKTRWDMSDEEYRLYATMLMCLPGSACLYQGEELGLEEADVAFEDLQDPYGIEFWPAYKGRDGCRTPIVWEDSFNANGGFSVGQPWLPIDPSHFAKSVAREEQKEESVLHHYRRAIALRRDYPVLRKGGHAPIRNDGSVVYVTREYEGQELFCAFNLSAEPAEFDMPQGNWKNIGEELGSLAFSDKPKQTLASWQSCLALKTDTKGS